MKLSPGGEIGKHSRLKICRRKACRFDSGSGHHNSAREARIRLNLIVALDRLKFNHIRLDLNAALAAKNWDNIILRLDASRHRWYMAVNFHRDGSSDG